MGNSYYTYVEEHKLLIECFCGETEIKDVFELKNVIESHLNQVPKLNILVDIQKNSSKPSFKKIDDFVEFYLKSEFSLKIDRFAFVTDTPRQVANTMLIIEGIQNEVDIPFKIFSSVESAINWLRSDISIDRVKSILEDFKNTSVLE
ncbi:MAG: STAS/SEC14 domain-containing protein [Labilibaculum sp.]|nr:STAS/SEC14 domain-containing protein [Labilibaculum sp.]